jgi:hypothetical protein
LRPQAAKLRLNEAILHDRGDDRALSTTSSAFFSISTLHRHRGGRPAVAVTAPDAARFPHSG